MVFSVFGISITLIELIAAIPKIIAAISAAKDLYALLTDKHNVEHIEAVQQSLDLFFKALAKLFYDIAGVTDIPLPHKMTPQEEELWFQRASQAASQL